jgi:hypothetical protein
LRTLAFGAVPGPRARLPVSHLRLSRDADRPVEQVRGVPDLSHVDPVALLIEVWITGGVRDAPNSLPRNDLALLAAQHVEVTVVIVDVLLADVAAP